MKYSFDQIVIGAGAAGLTASIGLAKTGKQVLLIEQDKMGGECTNSGCIPSKSLIHNARIGNGANKSLKKVREMISEIRAHEEPKELEKIKGLKVIKGHASFIDKHTINIQQFSLTGREKNTQYSAKYIVIASGSKPRIACIPGLEDKHILTNQNLFELKTAPKNLIILGGGPIGCEIAQAFARLGSKVTIITHSQYILSKEEVEISQEVQDDFKTQGITILNNTSIDKCEKGYAYIGRKKIPYSHVLLAIGRIPNVDALHLEDIEFSEDEIISAISKGISVNNHYQTKYKHIFAVGDCNTGPKFSHIADDQSRHVVKKILLPLTKTPKAKPNPRVTYLDKEVASTGLSYKDALKRYSEEHIVKITIPYNATDRAKTDEVQNGKAIIICKRLTGKIIGASLYGPGAGEIIASLNIAIQHNISAWKLQNTIFAYPTQSQIIKKLADAFMSHTLAHLKQDLWHTFKRQLPKIIALLFWATIIWTFVSYKEAHNLSNLDLIKQITQVITGTMYGPLLYIIFYFLRPITFFPATLLTTLSGALFGFGMGTVYTVIGENLSANLAYWIGYFFGKDSLKGDENNIFNKWKRKLNNDAFTSVLIMRFIFLPFDLTNYGCGILRVKWVSYALATAIGIIPGALTFIALGASVQNIEQVDFNNVSLDTNALILSAVLFISSLILAKIIKRKNKTA